MIKIKKEKVLQKNQIEIIVNIKAIIFLKLIFSLYIIIDRIIGIKISKEKTLYTIAKLYRVNALKKK